MYLLAEFAEHAKARQACSILGEGLAELVQLNRILYIVKPRPTGKLNCAEGRSTLKTRFPKAWELADEERMNESHSRTCEKAHPAVKHDFYLNCVRRGIPDLAEDCDLSTDPKGHLYLVGCEVSTDTSWEPLAQWLRARGAKAGWVSDYDVNPFTSIVTR